MLPKCLPTPRLFKCAPVQQSGEGNYGTANVDDRTSNAVCSPGRQRKRAITCVGNRGRHRFGQKPGRAGVPLDVASAYAIFRSRSLLVAPVSPNNAIISRLNAGMSSGLRLVTNPLSVETDVPPALRMSVLSEGRGWALRPQSVSFQPFTLPSIGETTCVCASASSRACLGSSNSDCSNPSATDMAILSPGEC